MSRYGTPLPWHWFLRRGGYRTFMAREATSIAIAAYLVYLLAWLRRLGQGPEAYEAMMQQMREALPIVLHALAFAAALYHSFTWFDLTPRIMPMYIGEERVADGWAATLMGYLPWTAVTAVVLWGTMR
jgi:fumarate reductase subunit C